MPPVDADQALRIARTFVGGLNDVRYDAKLTDADQWSFGVRGRMPLHRIAVEDADGTRLYVTESGGEVVLKTTASGRFWGWTGAVLHWLYFAPLRRQRGPVERNDRLAVDRRHGDVHRRHRCGGCGAWRRCAATAFAIIVNGRRTPGGCAGITTPA